MRSYLFDGETLLSRLGCVLIVPGTNLQLGTRDRLLLRSAWAAIDAAMVCCRQDGILRVGRPVNARARAHGVRGRPLRHSRRRVSTRTELLTCRHRSAAERHKCVVTQCNVDADAAPVCLECISADKFVAYTRSSVAQHLRQVMITSAPTVIVSLMPPSPAHFCSTKVDACTQSTCSLAVISHEPLLRLACWRCCALRRYSRCGGGGASRWPRWLARPVLARTCCTTLCTTHHSRRNSAITWQSLHVSAEIARAC